MMRQIYWYVTLDCTMYFVHPHGPLWSRGALVTGHSGHGDVWKTCSKLQFNLQCTGKVLVEQVLLESNVDCSPTIGLQWSL